MKLEKLRPMLAVTDLKRTMAFYCDKLGFKVEGTFGDPEPVWCQLARDGVSIMFNGRIIKEGGPELVTQLESEGYANIKEAAGVGA